MNEIVFGIITKVIGPIIVAVLGVLKAIIDKHGVKLVKSPVVYVILVLLAFAVVPTSYALLKRANEPGYWFRMTRSEDKNDTLLFLDSREKMLNLNGPLHFSKQEITYFIVNNDVYKIGQYEGEVLPGKKGPGRFFYLQYLTESSTKPKELFYNAKSRVRMDPTDTPQNIQSGTAGEWAIPIADDPFSFISVISYPGAASRRNEPDYILLSMFYSGGVDTYEFTIHFDTEQIRKGESLGVFSVSEEGWKFLRRAQLSVIELKEIPVFVKCGPPVVDAGLINHSLASNNLQALRTNLGNIRLTCSFSLGSTADGVYVVAFKRPT